MAWLTDHSLICLLLIATLFTGLWLFLQRERLRIRIGWILLLSPAHVIVGVVCVKLFAALENFRVGNFQLMSLFGAVFLLPLFYWIGAKLTKRKVSVVFDVFAVPMVFTLACARVNCLLSGCCRGVIIPGTSARYPTREAELVFYAVILTWFFLRTRRKTTNGILYPVYMIAYGCFRFVVEFFRESASSIGFLHLSHLWALLCLITGLSIWLEMRLRKPSNHPRKKT